MDHHVILKRICPAGGYQLTEAWRTRRIYRRYAAAPEMWLERRIPDLAGNVHGGVIAIIHGGGSPRHAGQPDPKALCCAKAPIMVNMNVRLNKVADVKRQLQSGEAVGMV